MKQPHTPHPAVAAILARFYAGHFGLGSHRPHPKAELEALLTSLLLPPLQAELGDTDEPPTDETVQAAQAIAERELTQLLTPVGIGWKVTAARSANGHDLDIKIHDLTLPNA